jgi:hypothetical protein
MLCAIPSTANRVFASSTSMNFQQFNASSGAPTNNQNNIDQQIHNMNSFASHAPMQLQVLQSNYTSPVAQPAALPSRVVGRNERQYSIEQFESPADFELAWSFPAGSTADDLKESESPDMLEPNGVFAFPQQGMHNPKDENTRTLLHRACQQYPRQKSVIKAALQKDRSAVLRRAFIPGRSAKNKANAGLAPEPYQLPINIALSHNASIEVLDILVKSDPSQLSQRDGIHGINSLCLALEKRPNDVAVLGMFLVTHPGLVRQHCDDHQNTPLHVACQRGSAIVRQLFRLHPASLFERNESGMTPMDILQQQVPYDKNARASLEYLQAKLNLIRTDSDGNSYGSHRQGSM